jgi:hypothetical protein
VTVVGALGGLTSVQQRFQSASMVGDPVDNVSVFIHGWWDMFTSLTSGAVFAAVLYLLIAGGLLSGELFPTMVVPDTVDEPTKSHLIMFLEKTACGSRKPVATVIRQISVHVITPPVVHHDDATHLPRGLP